MANVARRLAQVLAVVGLPACVGEPSGQHGLPAGRPASIGWELPAISLVESTRFSARVVLERNRLVHRTREVNPATGVTEESSSLSALAFDPIDVAGIDSHDCVVLGMHPDGSFLLERWRYEIPRGAYRLHRPLAEESPLGEPLRTPRATVMIEGGSYLPVDQRPSAAPRRDRVYEGRDYRVCRSILADPDGRFVWLIATRSSDDESVLDRFSLQGGPASTVLDSLQVSFLRQVDEFWVYKHESKQRLFFLSSTEPSAGTTEAIVITDANNDGIPESWTEMTYAEMERHPAYQAAQEDFLTY